MSGQRPTGGTNRQLTPLTPQYVSDVINHVARATVEFSVVDEREAEAAIAKYDGWAWRPPPGWPGIGYCEFASFFALELTRGTLCSGLGQGLRVRIALDFIVHIVLENGLMDQVWTVEDDLRAALSVLLSPSGTPEQLLTTFRIWPCGAARATPETTWEQSE